MKGVSRARGIAVLLIAMLFFVHACQQSQTPAGQAYQVGDSYVQRAIGNQTVVANSTITVNLSVVIIPTELDTYYAFEEKLPPGFTIINTSGVNSSNTSKNTMKWLYFSNTTAGSSIIRSYTIRVPSTPGVYTLNGTFQFEKTSGPNGTEESPTLGNNTITVVAAGAVCNNGIKEAGEQCDNASQNGVPCTPAYGSSCVYCSSACTNVTLSGAYCGDSIKNGPEQCDNGSQNGVACAPAYGSSCIYCNASCSNVTRVGPYCGDGLINGTEQCDGANLNGQTCISRGYTNGSLSCSPSCAFNTSACTNASNCTTVWYRDLDNDTYGNVSSTQVACSKPVGYVNNSLDCNDANAAVRPGATEACNGFDDNCNSQTDEGNTSLCTNGLYCDGLEYCGGTLGCRPGTAISCTANNTVVNTCTYNPDNINATFDNYSFVSVCNNNISACSSPPANWTSLISHTCSIASCGAQCQSASDCANVCISNVYYSGGSCSGSCSCSYGSSLNCSFQNGWYTATNRTWVSTGQCTEKEQALQWYRNYTCAPAGCGYTNTSLQWIDTGLTRPKSNGTLCDDGAFCTVNDICTSGACSGSARSCAANNTVVNTCTYNPDSINGTLDSYSFISSCNEANDTCTSAPSNWNSSISHACSMLSCGAQCETNANCSNTCVGSTRYYTGSCSGSCSCSYAGNESCTSYNGWYNTTNKRWINGSTCKEQEQQEQRFRTYSCAPSGCTYVNGSTQWINTSNTRNAPNGMACSDANLCTVTDVCSAGTCAGAPKNCGDSYSCTLDSCNLATGACINNNTNSLCTAPEVCNPSYFPNGTGCGNITANCAGRPDGTACSDGVYCNGPDQCLANSCRNVGPSINISDNIACTVDNCVESSNTTTHIANNSYCNNNLYCDGTEYCDVSQGCRNGTVVDCSASNLPAIGTCTNIPDANSYTWDSAAGFTSVCVNLNSTCTQGSYTFNHTCNVNTCNAQCDATHPCNDNDPATIDSCLANCSCLFTKNCVDLDADGFNSTGGSCGLVDCNDNNSLIHPGVVEVCDGIDNNCDSQIDENFVCGYVQVNESSAQQLSQPVVDAASGVSMRIPITPLTSSGNANVTIILNNWTDIIPGSVFVEENGVVKTATYIASTNSINWMANLSQSSMYLNFKVLSPSYAKLFEGSTTNPDGSALYSQNFTIASKNHLTNVKADIIVQQGYSFWVLMQTNPSGGDVTSIYHLNASSGTISFDAFNLSNKSFTLFGSIYPSTSNTTGLIIWSDTNNKTVYVNDQFNYYAYYYDANTRTALGNTTANCAINFANQWIYMQYNATAQHWVYKNQSYSAKGNYMYSIVCGALGYDTLQKHATSAITPLCGDAVCDTDFAESCSSCAADCGACPNNNNNGPSERRTTGPNNLPPVTEKVASFNFDGAFYRVTITYTSASTMNLNLKDRTDAIANIQVYDSAELVPAVAFTSAVLEYRVSKDWIDKNSIDPASITLKMKDTVGWKTIEGYVSKQDTTYIYYKATVKELGIFAVTGLAAKKSSEEQPGNLTQKPDDGTLSNKTLKDVLDGSKNKLDFLLYAGIIFIMITLIVVFFYWRAHHVLHAEHKAVVDQKMYELKNYISLELKRGVSQEEIKQVLRNVGWKEEVIDAMVEESLRAKTSLAAK